MNEKIEFPLVGIIYNWAGCKEENYLYTCGEMITFDNGLLEECLSKPTEWIASSQHELANKTWSGKLIKDVEELKRFLSGKYNGEELLNDPDWYWELFLPNDLYGVRSNTLCDALQVVATYRDYEWRDSIEPMSRLVRIKSNRICHRHLVGLIGEVFGYGRRESGCQVFGVSLDGKDYEFYEYELEAVDLEV